MQTTTIVCEICGASKTIRASAYEGIVRRTGKPQRTCGVRCGSVLRERTRDRSQHPRWKGGQPWLGKNGYYYIGKELLHRKIYEEHHGVKLKAGEIVHHANHDRTDNRIENLVYYPSHSAHMAHEHAEHLRPGSPRYTDEDLLAGLRAIVLELGRPPTADEMRGRKPGLETYARRFGSWKEARSRASPR